MVVASHMPQRRLAVGENNMKPTFQEGAAAAAATRAWCPKRTLAAAGRLRLGAACVFLLASPVWSAQSEATALTNLSLEELGELRVTSVSKKEQRLADAAAAIYVITEDAIRRAGARTLPEALRLAPNLQVAQIDAKTYTVTARGFNTGSTNNKLLVLIDGRTVYTPLYSGVFWEVQDVLLQDIDRIEVISGPGGTLWGANAVNGVINVISKKADSTVGELGYVMGGNTGRALALRHGGALDADGGAYRFYAKADQGRHTTRINGVDGLDGWERWQLGFRSDWRLAHSELTVQGDAYRSSGDQTPTGQQRNTGANLQIRWNQTLADGAALRLQSYLDRTTRDIPGTFSEQLNTLDFDVQYSMPNGAGQQTIWGAGYRVADDHVGNTNALAFLPANRKLHWTNVFVQHERAVLPDLSLSLGAKAETNDYTGLEFLPSLKLAWKPSDPQLLWAGLSRAVRAPSRIDTDFYVPGKPPYQLAGGPDFKSEIANTLELGWRAQQGQSLSYSVVLSHSKYDHLRSLDTLPGRIIVFRNQVSGRVDALEAWASYQLSSAWSLDASAVLLHERFSGANLASSSPGNDPRARWTLGSRWNINDRQFLDVRLRHVGKLPSPAIAAYTAVDAHFGWRVSKAVELSFSGRNLFDPRHQEFAPSTAAQRANPVQLERALDVALTVRF